MLQRSMEIRRGKELAEEAHQKLYAREEFVPRWSNFWHCQVGCDDDEHEPLGQYLVFTVVLLND